MSAPLYAGLAAVLATRLDRYPVDGGLPSLDPVAVSISPAEQETASMVAGRTIAAGTPIPQHLQDKAIRALEAPVEELIGRGIIGSGEMLAAVLPQLTATVLAADMTDPDVVELYEQLYTAFRRRRSLLLIDLAHQVRFSELPWVIALDPLRRNRNDTSSQTTAARTLLRQIAVVAIESFPHAVLPNPLVREFGALARSSGLDLPLVEEVAADIFMGTFTEKWRAAAVTASRVLHDTVYQAYYDLPTTSQWDVQRRTLIRWHKATTLDFTALCEQRAAEAGTGDNYVARNGAVLEQSQILTTHNLSALVQALELEHPLREIAPDAAQRTFDWVLQRLSQPAVDHAALIQVKNAAYAWRQAIFLLSYCDRATQHAHLHQLSEHTTGSRLAPAVAGLVHILDGGRFTPDGLTPDGVGRRFLGWAVGKHWYFR